MVGGLFLLFTSACVAALVGQAHAQDFPRCASAQWGEFLLPNHSIKPIEIGASVIDEVVKLPFLAGCRLVGVRAELCDPGQRGHLSFIDETTLRVHRQPNNNKAFVRASMSCTPFYPPNVH